MVHLKWMCPRVCIVDNKIYMSWTVFIDPADLALANCKVPH